MERNGAPWNQKNGAGMWKRKHRSHDTGFGFRPQPSIHNPDPNPNPSHSSVSPDPSQFAPTVHQFLAHRDAFRFLWGQLDDALTARERLVLMKEEEIRRKEQALCDHEGLIEALKKEVVHWKAEASHYKNQFLSLKSQAEHQIRGNAESRGDCSLVRENDESQLCNRQENASANPCTYQKEENACLFKSSRVDEHLTAGDGIDEDCCLPSLQSVEICHSSNISAIKCFDRSTADAAGASPCTTAHSLPFSGYLTCSIEDMTGSCPAAESQAGNCIGSGQIPEPSLVTSPVNGDMTVNGNGRVVDAPVSNFPVKVKIEQIEDAPMVTFHDELDSSENIIPQMKLDDSLVNKERNVNSNSHMLDTALSILPVKVKTEPIESHAIVPVCNGLDSSVTQDLPVSIKNENPDDFMDELDHISLHERTKMLLQSKLSPRSISSELGECAGRTLPPEHESSELLNHKARDLKIQSRKKRTPTSSVEVALEEDAPGLLQILLERGLQLDEIKLYGNMENEDGHETLPDADGFAELETVISKLFSRPAMILKLAKVFHNKGSKASYCLACLISLIEQTRYLQLHKWSVEWGWCRDLLSFIFVFERHNRWHLVSLFDYLWVDLFTEFLVLTSELLLGVRIVLERPEYGYATYFFELVPSLPIDWQIRRLIAAMKLTSCTRSTLLENRPLVVGEDLTEDEARTLEDYGWRPNTGLGSMLNYCDRVVHDNKTEDPSEWKSKIGKLLMNGYDQGTISLPNIPKKVLALKTEVLALETGLSSQLKVEH